MSYRLKSIIVSVPSANGGYDVVPEAAEVHGHTIAWIINLSALLGFAAELPDKFHHLRNAGCTDRMSFRLQPA